MLIFSKPIEISAEIERLKSLGKTIGFVPTMGALHKGHISLVGESVKNNDVTVVSIFVNPIQFNDKNDLESYPRTLGNDQLMLEEAGCDLLFIPEVKEIYPEGEVIEKYDFGHLDEVMEGKYRPGHFNGVAVVVSRFFDILKPHNAYFGLKDYQQYRIIKELIKIQKRVINIVGCPIIREKGGLAMSSRNVRISETNRKKANELYRILREARLLKHKFNIDEIKNWVKTEIDKTGIFRLEYFELVNSENLLPVKFIENNSIIACIAVYLENVRLIDNIEF